MDFSRVFSKQIVVNICLHRPVLDPNHPEVEPVRILYQSTLAAPPPEQGGACCF
jgi:hypothetical protein